MNNTNLLTKNKNFLLLWTGKLVSGLGDKMYAIAMAWWILQASQSPAVMGLYLASSALPAILLGIFAGAVIDKSNLKNILIITDVVRGIAICMLAALYISGMLMVWHVFALTIIISMASAFFSPAVVTITPAIVENEKLGKANSFMQMIDGIATIAGPIAGVAVVGIIGYFGAFLLNGISFLLSAFFEGFIHVPKSAAAKQGKTTLKILKDIKEGYKFILSKPKLIEIILIICIAHFFVGAVSVMMPYIAENMPQGSINFLGIMQMIFGAGFVAGAVFISRKQNMQAEIKNISVFFAVIGISLVVMSAASFFGLFPYVFYLLPVFAIGFSTVSASIYWQTSIQITADADKLGRVSAVSSLAGNITLPIAYAFYGMLLGMYNFAAVAFASGCGMVLFVAAIVIFDLKRRKKDEQEKIICD